MDARLTLLCWCRRDRAGWFGGGGYSRDGMRWEINKTVTYLPFPGAGLHALSAVSSIFLSPPIFPCRLFSSRSISLPLPLSLFHSHRCAEPGSLYAGSAAAETRR